MCGLHQQKKLFLLLDIFVGPTELVVVELTLPTPIQEPSPQPTAPGLGFICFFFVCAVEIKGWRKASPGSVCVSLRYPSAWGRVAAQLLLAGMCVRSRSVPRRGAEPGSQEPQTYRGKEAEKVSFGAGDRGRKGGKRFASFLH